jgi:hypothetical protein
MPATAMATRSKGSYRRSCRQLRESGARELSKSAEAVTLLYATVVLALMVRSPWLAASYDLPQPCLPKGEFVLLKNVANVQRQLPG